MTQADYIDRHHAEWTPTTVTNLTDAVDELERRNAADEAIPTGLQNTQPVAIGVTVAAVPQLVMALCTAFHVFTFTGEQQVAVQSAWATLVIAIGWWLHARVTSPASAAKLERKV